jgi:hypothetical protein
MMKRNNVSGTGKWKRCELSEIFSYYIIKVAKINLLFFAVLVDWIHLPPD